MKIFVFFNLFPINMILQYKKIGKWRDYVYGERGYIILSLVAKSVLAWLAFAGAMQLLRLIRENLESLGMDIAESEKKGSL